MIRRTQEPMSLEHACGRVYSYDSSDLVDILECFLIQSQIQAKSFLFLGFDEASGKKNFICYKFQLSMKFVFLDLLYFFFMLSDLILTGTALS